MISKLFFREFKSLDGHDQSLERYVRKYSDIVFGEEITWEVFKVWEWMSRGIRT